MDPANLPPFLQRAIERLKRAFNPERLVLFGSYAKGTARPDSDVDLLIVADLVGEPAMHLRRARQLVADSFPVIDVVICTPEDFDNAETAPSPFLHSVIGSGITVYRRHD